ncbi:Glycogenin-1 [Taenia crassiceps]|uniref:glycogenin glucosyltransferase n=1 Tax=Taenia crassiceps TaxID=6207 RepID=A0ABR4QH75_9CEST
MSNDDAHSTYSLVEDLFGELIDILLLISNWLTVAVAVERYIAICYPLYVRCLSHRVRKRIVFCIIFTAIILQFPSLAKYWSVLEPLSIALSYFNLWFTRVLVLLIFPCTILICVNVRLIQAIRSSFILKHYTISPAALHLPSNDCSTTNCKSHISRSTRLTVPFTVNGSPAREVGQHASREERAIIINLTCLIAAFFLCQFPFIFLSVAFKLYESDVDNAAFRSANLTFLHKTFVCNEDFLNQTLYSSLTSSTTAITSAASTIIDTELDILAYIRALSVIFLMLKGDLYFLLYCGLCDVCAGMAEAYVTLATNDEYCCGALVLADSLRKVGTSKKLVCMVTNSVSDKMRTALDDFFDHIELVDVLDSSDSDNLKLLSRPDLGVTFTKLHCWRLTQYSKCVFMDADTLVLQNIDDLFEREELSAAPDPGWPDCFNSGVFVYTPSLDTYRALLDFALSEGSFDGGDQGLLNLFFSDWSTKDIRRHLPFTYNCIAQAFYSYPPAMKRFGSQIRVVHFIGAAKPWHQQVNTETGSLTPCDEISAQSLRFLNVWWHLFFTDIKPKINPSVGGLVGHLATLDVSEGPILREQPPASSSTDRQGSWERGVIDYTGADRFSNIQAALDKRLGNTRPWTICYMSEVTAPPIRSSTTHAGVVLMPCQQQYQRQQRQRKS